MRKLTPKEIAKIDQRLESLKIQYLEIYHEIWDHYFTELEKKPIEEFESTFKQLNETFAWSIVKKMEKELRKATNKQVSQMQWEALKFWKLTPFELACMLTSVALYFSCYWLWKAEGAIVFIASMALVGIVIIWKNQGQGIAWNLGIIKQKPVKSLQTAIFFRLGLFYGVLSWYFIGINNWGNFNPGIIGNLIIWPSSTAILSYILTLVKVSFSFSNLNQERITS